MYVIAVCGPLESTQIKIFAEQFARAAEAQAIPVYVLNESDFCTSVPGDEIQPDVKDLYMPEPVEAVEDLVFQMEEEPCEKEALPPVVTLNVKGLLDEINVNVNNEGLMLVFGHRLFLHSELRDVFNHKLFLITSPEQCLTDYLRNKPNEDCVKGSIKNTMQLFFKTIKPVNEKDVLPSRKYAESHIPETSDYSKTIELLLSQYVCKSGMNINN